MTQSLEEERKRIMWRQQLMVTAEGREWLRHLHTLWRGKEKFLGPDHSGVPRGLLDTAHQTGYL